MEEEGRAKKREKGAGLEDARCDQLLKSRLDARPLT